MTIKEAIQDIKRQITQLDKDNFEQYGEKILQDLLIIENELQPKTCCGYRPAEQKKNIRPDKIEDVIGLS